MSKGLRFVEIDLLIQRVVGSVYLFTGLLGLISPVFLIITLLTQIILGGWQVISAIVIAIINKSMERKIYLLFVFTYLFTSSIISFYVLENSINSVFGLFIFGGVIIPFGCAVWYYLLTVKTYKIMLQHPDLDVNYIQDMEKVLDSGELIRKTNPLKKSK